MQSKFCLLVACLLCIGGARCQDTTRYKGFSVLLSPALVPAAPTAFALQAGVQFRLQRWSIAVQVATPVHKPSEFSSVHYLRQSLELKRYFKKKPDWEEFLAAEVQYANRRFIDTDGGTYFKHDVVSDSRFSYSQARIQSPIFVAMVKVGATFVVNKKLFMDGFVRAGARTIYTKYMDVAGEAPQPYGWLEIFSGPKSAYRYNKTISKPHVAAGFRFGYVLQ